MWELILSKNSFSFSYVELTLIKLTVLNFIEISKTKVTLLGL
ncbi:hypothetical protein LEP1GSC021_4170 [Leptospira noguchii str. 1993005606]|uniref:Uncharacterized protein n=2 Tax=Leptospira noguchii TaxID=28182 RepID=M6YPX5_9LEPT|nr:hypothetical protein LEP1GSC072_3212 [Leptospira noguchii str. Bonito]EMN00549.1 hypothetical protein LEP1GSC035_2944 [Leptospira noguchii str. 2007001578]EMO88373.1 hypothetical protein LEP1GSC024_4632 [Leptospira noguchii str. 2001034031]EPE81995.1 hypothetical protein LEP1GSC021_4170 [Leptospira noguchii str. 1993005606]